MIHSSKYQGRLALEIARVIGARIGLTASPRILPGPRDRPQAAAAVDRACQNVRGAFACELDLTGLTITIVDDVMTTGAFLAEAARVLKGSGAAAVENWVVARTLPPTTF